MSEPSHPERYNFARDCIAFQSRMRGDARALLWIDRTGHPVELTFADVEQRAAMAASVLTRLGVRRGDTVLLLLGREIVWWELMLGCLWIGAIVSPGTVQLTPKDIAYRCRAAKAACIIAGAQAAEQVEEALIDASLPRLYVDGSRDGWTSYYQACAAAPARFDFADTAFDEPALCYFTSGTTGYPKMTMHGAGYPIAHRLTGQYWLQIGPDDLLWNLSDTGWAKAAWSSLFAPWVGGACVMAYQEADFDPAKILDLLERFPVTTLCAPPTAYRMLVRFGRERIRSRSLRRCVSGGEPLNPEVIDLWHRMTGLEIGDGYGQTETVILCCNRPGAARTGTMGKPVPGIDLAVTDQDGNRLPPGEEGDICLRVAEERPPGLFLGYRDEPERTAATFRDGWYVTGDRGTVDQQGFFRFVGRADDVILTSGYRIGPFEVESALFEHKAVAESAVVASPDETRGEVVKAFIVLTKGYTPSTPLVKELQDHVKASTAPYKYPRKIEFVAALPKTVSGKILRRRLRDAEWDGRQ